MHRWTHICSRAPLSLFYFFYFFLTCLFPDSLLTLALSHQDQLLDLILGPDLVWQSDYKSLCSHICEESKRKKKNTWEFDTFNQQINLKIKVIGMVTSIVIMSRESLLLHFTGTHLPCSDFNTGWCCGQLQDCKLLTCIKKLDLYGPRGICSSVTCHDLMVLLTTVFSVYSV